MLRFPYYNMKDFFNISYTTLYLVKNLLANWLSSSAGGFESGKGNIIEIKAKNAFKDIIF
jgi:hypothetical protein